MTTNQDLTSTTEGQMPVVSPGNYSPVTVTVKDTLGTIFLGVRAGILLGGVDACGSTLSDPDHSIGGNRWNPFA